MRFSGLTGLLALSVCAACSSPAAPELTGIVVTVDWTVARQTGFVDARWHLIRYAAGSDWEVPVDSGEIDTDGSATIRFQDDCIEERDFLTTHLIRVSGHFSEHERSSLPDCEFVPVRVRCMSTPQSLGFEGGSPAEACTAP